MVGPWECRSSLGGGVLCWHPGFSGPGRSWDQGLAVDRLPEERARGMEAVRTINQWNEGLKWRVSRRSENEEVVVTAIGSFLLIRHQEMQEMVCGSRKPRGVSREWIADAGNVDAFYRSMHRIQTIILRSTMLSICRKPQGPKDCHPADGREIDA